MPNMERAERAAARAKRKTMTREGLRQTVPDTAGEVEVPLRDALRMVHVLSLVDQPKGQDAESIAYVAREAAIRLEMVRDELRGLFGSCVAEF